MAAININNDAALDELRSAAQLDPAVLVHIGGWIPRIGMNQVYVDAPNLRKALQIFTTAADVIGAWVR